jgi:hypothetical protein
VSGLTSEQILRAWEAGVAARPVDRPIALLAAAGADREELVQLPIGERDARLLELRARTFGPTLDVVVDCPACREQLECPIEIARLVDAPRGPQAHVLALDDGEVDVRLLDSRDLAAASDIADVDVASAYLLDASIVAVRRTGGRALSESERADLAGRIGELDPRADLLLDAVCPACNHAWLAPFDPSTFVFTEISAAARRLLRQVATLARSFGWTESEVLALSPTRRRAYLELAEPAGAS